jgi:putative flippase GtrA
VDGQRKEHARALILQFIRYNAVGAANTAFAYGVYAGLVALGVNHFLALFADYAVGTVTGYFLHKRITFGQSERRGPLAFARMAGLTVAQFLVNTALLWALVDLGGLDTYLGQAMALVVVTCAGFLAQKYVVFRR